MAPHKSRNTSNYKIERHAQLDICKSTLINDFLFDKLLVISVNVRKIKITKKNINIKKYYLDV